ncbi:D-alanyl-D-alanine carboxypeptidase family protein [Sphingosinithalassobacter sp. CS137]|uniref:D-alanyl-D-alanine carboxypeptidase family protein n=1 Tax=Sphingosinithalassobacter sp. CS137 TaxID=2762748 RepID=UPI00165E8D5B|nr:D-alanyl-D-alanine carboxypeptidase family protein [Sphingosinithalassobacter sp. CS137]
MKKLFAALSALLLAIPAAAQAPSFDTPAEIAFMKDLSSGAVLFARNPDRRIPPASMAKMMTTYVAFDLIKRGELSLDKKVEVRPETWRQWHSQGSTMFLSANQQVSIGDLLHGVVTLSGNDASVVLAEGIAGTEEAFVNLMNQKARELGLSNSHFGNSNGWPDEGRTYVSARDLATLAAATIQNFPDLYERFYSQHDFAWTTADGTTIRQPNRDPLLGRVEGADGLKTGHTEEAGYGFTGSAEQNGRRLVMVLAGLDSYGGRAEESVRFMQWGFRAWNARPIVNQGRVVETAEVQGGSAGSVGLVAPQALTVTVPAGSAPDMQARVVYQGPIQAPIAAGDHIADLIVTIPGMEPQTLPLVAEKDVAEAGFFRRIWVGLMSLLGLA